MRPYAGLDKSDGNPGALRALTQRPTELEVQPSPNTEQIATELIARHDAHTRRRQHSA
jgi:hypothetical protein